MKFYTNVTAVIDVQQAVNFCMAQLMPSMTSVLFFPYFIHFSK